MAEVGRDIKTPVPSNGRSRLPSLPALAGGAWAVLVAVAIVATNFVYATKGELRDQGDKLAEHAKEEASGMADLRTRESVAETHLEEHHRALEKHDLFLDALDQNVRTLMLEMSIPSNRIARPKKP